MINGDFGNVLHELEHDKRVTRDSWDTAPKQLIMAQITIKDNVVKPFIFSINQSGNIEPWYITMEDALAKDYRIVDPEQYL